MMNPNEDPLLMLFNNPLLPHNVLNSLTMGGQIGPPGGEPAITAHQFSNHIRVINRNKVIIPMAARGATSQVIVTPAYTASWQATKTILKAGRTQDIIEPISAVEGTPVVLITGKTPAGTVSQIVLVETQKIGKSTAEIAGEARDKEAEISSFINAFQLSHEDAVYLWQQGYRYEDLEGQSPEYVHRLLGKTYVPPVHKQIAPKIMSRHGLTEDEALKLIGIVGPQTALNMNKKQAYDTLGKSFEPSIDEVARKLKITPREVEEIQAYSGRSLADLYNLNPQSVKIIQKNMFKETLTLEDVSKETRIPMEDLILLQQSKYYTPYDILTKHQESPKALHSEIENLKAQSRREEYTSTFNDVILTKGLVGYEDELKQIMTEYDLTPYDLMKMDQPEIMGLIREQEWKVPPKSYLELSQRLDVSENDLMLYSEKTGLDPAGIWTKVVVRQCKGDIECAKSAITSKVEYQKELEAMITWQDVGREKDVTGYELGLLRDHGYGPEQVMGMSNTDIRNLIEEWEKPEPKTWDDVKLKHHITDKDVEALNDMGLVDSTAAYHMPYSDIQKLLSDYKVTIEPDKLLARLQENLPPEYANMLAGGKTPTQVKNEIDKDIEEQLQKMWDSIPIAERCKFVYAGDVGKAAQCASPWACAAVGYAAGGIIGGPAGYLVCKGYQDKAKNMKKPPGAFKEAMQPLAMTKLEIDPTSYADLDTLINLNV